jgi:hypothetical protein
MLVIKSSVIFILILSIVPLSNGTPPRAAKERARKTIAQIARDNKQQTPLKKKSRKKRVKKIPKAAQYVHPQYSMLRLPNY